MRIFGWEITKAASVPTPVYSNPYGGRGWYPLVHEPFTGAWQRNIEIRQETVLAYSAVYAVVTLIASDISKLRLYLAERDVNGIWTETSSPAFSPVLRKPNRYQTRIKFIEQWVVSKLLAGNTYILKERDQRGVVTAMYILDPRRTKVLVAPDGEVYYELSKDNLSGIEENNITVPASEIIHDTMVPLFHPLCGVSPIYACGLAAVQGLAIQNTSTAFFQNEARPSGILIAPTAMDQQDAERLKIMWTERFSGPNAGRIAVFDNGLQYTPLTMNAVDAALIDQLKWTAETVCTTFHVPPYMVGIGQLPNFASVEAMNQQYYTQALQAIIESIELSLDEGLGLLVGEQRYGTKFNINDLLRMDTATKVRSAVEGLKGVFTPNEVRKQFDLKPKPGGDSPYLQQQNFSLEALAKRDAKEDPFQTSSGGDGGAAEPDDEEPDEPPEDSDEELAAAASFAALKLKSLLAA